MQGLCLPWHICYICKSFKKARAEQKATEFGYGKKVFRDEKTQPAMFYTHTWFKRPYLNTWQTWS